MKKFFLGTAAFLLVAATAAITTASQTPPSYYIPSFENRMYASSAEAGWFHVVDQRGVQDQWVIQGPDQNWAGAAVMQPGVINYANFLGAPNEQSAGWGGMAAGGSLVLGFDRAFVDGDGDDFIVRGFGLGFNRPFTDERGTVRIYVSDAYDNTSHDSTDWTLLSEWQGRADGQWIGNSEFNYCSGVEEYGWILKGDLADAGLDLARYIKIDLGDGGQHVKSSGAIVTHGRALFIDSAEARAVPVPAAVWMLGSGLAALAGVRRTRV